ncbi:MAG: hypothetical protein KC431_24545, partial [Myxococcales bacterium]|nr:hypothetical protein [Myxococcales bacterium]
MRSSLTVAAVSLGLGLWIGASTPWADAAPAKTDDKAEPSAVRPLVEPVGEAPADYSRYRKL